MRGEIHYCCHQFLQRWRWERATTQSWLSTSVAVLLALVLFIDVARADDPPPPADRTKKAARWKPALLESGHGWWCNTMECARSRPACELGVTTCKEQRRAWGFSYFFWNPDAQVSPEVPGAWHASANPTRSQCEEMRRMVLEDDEYSSVSSCTPLGDRPIDGLPPGRGWWCTRAKSVALDVETSLCSRARTECLAGTKELGTAKVKNTVGALEVIHACRRATTAWASKVSYPTPRLKVFETQSDCEAVALGATCHKVK